MHILVLPSWFPSPDYPVYGTFIREQAVLMCKRGIEVGILYVDNREAQRVHTNDEIQMSELDGCVLFKKNVVRIPKLGRFLVNKWAAHYDQLYDKYIEKHGRPDIIHAHGYIAGFAARRLSSKHGVKLILTLHGSDVLKGNIKRWHRAEFSKLLKECHSVITVSEKLRSRLDDSYLEKTVVIPNLIDDELFFVVPKSTSAIEILVLGNLTINKRVDLAIRSFAKWATSGNRDAMLKIVGDGSILIDLEKLARKLGVESQVQLIKGVPLQKVPILFSTATLLMIMSEVETFGKVTIESLACGVPVIASKSADPEQIVKEGMGKRVSANMPEIVAAIEEVVSGRGILPPEQLHQYAVKNFGSKTILERITQVYQLAIDSPIEN